MTKQVRSSSGEESRHQSDAAGSSPATEHLLGPLDVADYLREREPMTSQAVLVLVAKLREGLDEPLRAAQGAVFALRMHVMGEQQRIDGYLREARALLVSSEVEG